MKIFRIICALTLFMAIGLSAQTRTKTIEEAKVLAMKENKKIVVEFSTDWCTYCKKFAKNILPDKAVQTKLQDFVFVEINPEKFSDEFTKMNDEKSYPKFILLNEKGKILKKNIGFLGAKNFLEFLN